MEKYLPIFLLGFSLFVAIFGTVDMLRQISRLKDEE
jgi:hypothetical protein